uniref:Uncharacterized protein n=1 Tax=Branchiostoma floridae TaxID=7739 RepID=C3XTZ4_BRAFL|eukprot:XP_002612358.1 hypothetical protein BRAFLDRAFT_79988 [Branchiostoma floridae]
MVTNIIPLSLLVLPPLYYTSRQLPAFCCKRLENVLRFDPAARYDTEAALSSLIPEKSDIWTRICEGSDDMPALVKNCLVGCNLTIPISNGILNTGHGQGIWLLEHKNYGGGRKLVITVQGMYKPTFNKPLGSLGL